MTALPPGDRRPGRGDRLPPEEVIQFEALVRARRTGDVQAAMRHVRILKGLGWSIVACEPREGRGGRKP